MHASVIGVFLVTRLLSWSTMIVYRILWQFWNDERHVWLSVCIYSRAMIQSYDQSHCRKLFLYRIQIIFCLWLNEGLCVNQLCCWITEIRHGTRKPRHKSQSTSHTCENICKDGKQFYGMIECEQMYKSLPRPSLSFLSSLPQSVELQWVSWV